MDALITKYIELRDAKAALDGAHKEKMAKVNAMLEKIEGFILADFNESGIDSARCSKGTAYKSTKTSATVADWDATFAFIKERELWNMLEHRVSKTAVEEFRNEHNDLPPGLNWREEVTINVRRS